MSLDYGQTDSEGVFTECGKNRHLSSNHVRNRLTLLTLPLKGVSGFMVVFNKLRFTDL